jgi:hypothetical protein
MAGVPEDGRQCEQDAEIRATLQTNVVSITVKKPGVSRDTLRAIIQATGEHPYKIGLNVSVSRLDGSAWPSSRLVVGAVTAVPTNQTSVSAFGQFIEWHNPYPPLYWAADLDNAHFSDTWEQAFHLRLECDNKLDCVADGDILETIVSVKSQQDARLSSRVTILAMVESLMSCENSKAQMTQAGKIVQGSAISAENSLRVRIEAFDVDGYMISRTRAEIEFRCNNETLLLQPWSPGSNEYVAEVPPDLLLHLGQFDLVVRALNGWNQTSRKMAPCDLLRITLVATSQSSQPLNPTWIALGFFIALLCLLAGLSLCWYLRSSNASKRLAERKRRLLHELQKEYSVTGNLGPMNSVNSDGDLPLHIALACSAPCSLVSAILASYPEGAQRVDARGNLPLHVLVQGLSNQTDWKAAQSSMSLLLEAFPGGILQPDMHSKLPIQILLDACLHTAGSGELGIELGFPLDCNGSAGNWLCLLAHSPKQVLLSPPKESFVLSPTASRVPSSTPPDSHSTSILRSEWLVDKIITRAQDSRRATIQELAYATDAWGREAWAVATKEHRKCLWKYLLFCGRYGCRS